MVSALTGYRIMKAGSGRTPTMLPVADQDAIFAEIYERCKDFSMNRKERMYSLYLAINYLIDSKIGGDFIECGVYKGGNTMLMALTLLARGETDRKIYCYDTFEGMIQPTDSDYSVVHGTKAIYEWKRQKKEDHNTWCYSPLSEVTRAMYSTGYPKENIIFVKGKVEETIPATMPSSVALLRLDTDWYESTKHELQHLYPALVHRGVLIIDDYGTWAGSKKAVDEYFADTPILLNVMDTTGRIGIKMSAQNICLPCVE